MNTVNPSSAPWTEENLIALARAANFKVPNAIRNRIEKTIPAVKKLREDAGKLGLSGKKDRLLAQQRVSLTAARDGLAVPSQQSSEAIQDAVSAEIETLKSCANELTKEVQPAVKELFEKLVAVGENVEDELRRTEREAAEKFGVTFEESRTLSTIRSAITATKRRATESVSLDTSLLSKLLAL